MAHKIPQDRRAVTVPEKAPRAGDLRGAQASLGLRCWVGGLLALLLTLAPAAHRDARAAALLVHLTNPADRSAWFTCILSPTVEQPLTLELHDGAVRARLYSSRRAPQGPGIVLLHGVHPLGIDEPRLAAFARALAATGARVLTPELPELLAYRIEASTTDHILALARDHALRTGQRAVGVIGISFAGGLSLMAAAKQTQPAPIAFVVALGAHHDLMRLTRYYAGLDVRGPHGEPARSTPHPYGARVLLREHLDRFFAAADVAAARVALDTYLHDEHRLAKQRALALSPAGQRIMSVLLDESQHAELDQLLLTAAALEQPALAAASPRGKLARLSVPVFLLHGQADPVIPSLETSWLAQEVPAHWLRRVLITPLLRHAEFPQPPTLRESWQVVRFIDALLSAADAAALNRRPRGP